MNTFHRLVIQNCKVNYQMTKVTARGERVKSKYFLVGEKSGSRDKERERKSSEKESSKEQHGSAVEEPVQSGDPNNQDELEPGETN